MRFFGYELVFRRVPEEMPSEVVEVRTEDIAHDLLRDVIITPQDFLSINFHGFRATLVKTPFVGEPVLLVPTENSSLDRYSRERFGGPPAQVFRRAPFPSLRRPPTDVATVREGVLPSTSADLAPDQSPGSRQ